MAADIPPAETQPAETQPAETQPAGTQPTKAPPAASRSAKPLRADAARNRAKVLDAARDVFAELGTGASTEEVARRAGVGIGTVFRHFPTKESLLEAVLGEILAGFAEQAKARTGAADPGGAFFDFFQLVVGESATKNAVSAELAGAGIDIAAGRADVRQELRGALGVLLTRAQEAGVVRADVGLGEVLALLAGTSQAAGKLDVATRARVLDVVFDGLRSQPS
ncbi:TetR/AcrR family transcriptional regulator [Actinomadura logoneensis]|uniref:TetR/AcrR family transcriptional regulator n=1 Tax=Actinomadura logoneensis TaxID=2293572 RepID=A0A372JMQ6_9ACTN|nr:TetR/AcrR family transcriptional regulator [Actinomadura logoneensis]RFU41292.1 TetR/AcrR family transcriptional regulator [Actinomadura logoneensis]